MFKNKKSFKDKVKEGEKLLEHQTLVAINQLITQIADLIVILTEKESSTA